MAVFNDVAGAAKTVIDGLGLGVTTVVRKDGVVKVRDSLPLIVISLGTDAGEQWATLGDGSTDQGTLGKDYALDIEVYRENQADVASDTTNPNLFQTVKRALNKATLSGATTVWDTQLESNEQWEGRDFAKGGEVSGFRLHFGSAEVRNV